MQFLISFKGDQSFYLNGIEEEIIACGNNARCALLMLFSNKKGLRSSASPFRNRFHTTNPKKIYFFKLTFLFLLTDRFS